MDSLKFGKLLYWELEVDVKYRSESETEENEDSESSDLIINRKIDIEDDFVFNY